MTPSFLQSQTRVLQASRKSNLAFSFLSLKGESRKAMVVFYDYCRWVDDIVDDTKQSTEAKKEQLNFCRAEMERCYSKEIIPGSPLGQKMKGIITRFLLPKTLLLAIIEGVSQDLTTLRYATFEELRQYCYKVASAVGLVSVKIFGCEEPSSSLFAENLGYALQLTNILRDVVEDYQRYGRIYIPQEELKAFHVEEKDLVDPSLHGGCRQLFRLQYFRAKHFFNKAYRLVPVKEREKLKASLIMAAFYEAILDKIASQHFILTKKKVYLSIGEKGRLFRKTMKSLKRDPKGLLPSGKVAVWGGGVAGMVTAVELAYRGFEVTLFEARSYLGGRAHSFTDRSSGIVLDNGAHVLMGGYPYFFQFLKRLGLEKKVKGQKRLALSFCLERRRIFLKAFPLSAPWHLLGAILCFKGLTGRDRWAAIQFCFCLRKPAVQSVQDWLVREKQTEGIIQKLWRPFCLAALNEEPAFASALLFYNVLKGSLLGKARDSGIYVNTVPLGDLFLPEVGWFLQGSEGCIHLGQQVKRIETNGSRVKGFHTASGAFCQADYYVSALPWYSLAPLLEDSHWKRKMNSLRCSPILSIYLLCDRALFSDSFVGFLDSPIHWMFDRSCLLSVEKKEHSHLYAITVSAAGEQMNVTHREILARVERELIRFFPAAEKMQIKQYWVLKRKDATFRAAPGVERPGAKTPWENCFLAGDWTDTGLPATLEGAAKSGFEVAKILS